MTYQEKQKIRRLHDDVVNSLENAKSSLSLYRIYLDEISKSVFNYHEFGGLDDENLFASLEEKTVVDLSTETTTIKGVDVDSANREIVAMTEFVSEAKYRVSEAQDAYLELFRNQVEPALSISQKIPLPSASLPLPPILAISSPASSLGSPASSLDSTTSPLSGLKRQRPDNGEGASSNPSPKKSRISETTSSKRPPDEEIQGTSPTKKSRKGKEKNLE